MQRSTAFLCMLSLLGAGVAEEGVPSQAVPATGRPAGGELPAQGHGATQALERLLQGNQRFIREVAQQGDRSGQRRVAVARGQNPFAIVVCCSDSRVPPEQLFDVGLGDIFVIRVAGNVLDAIGLGSIEYAAAHLHVPLVMVVGHEHCGAVTAALAGDPAPGHVRAIVERIQQNLAGTVPVAGDALDHSVCTNATAVARQVASAQPLLKDMVMTGKLRVVAARYDLDDGAITILP